MRGREIPKPPSAWTEGACPFAPGDYWQDEASHWHGVTPNGLLTNLSGHRIERTANGAISVFPSIHVSDGRTSWHGFLCAGQWVPC